MASKTPTAVRPDSQRHLLWSIVSRILVLLLAGGIVLGNIACSDSVRETPSQTEAVETALVENPPAQTEPEVAVPATIQLLETQWAEVAELPQNPGQQDMAATDRVWLPTQEWFVEKVWPYIQQDPWFLIPSEEGTRLTGGIIWLIADGNVWFASVIDGTCIDCSAEFVPDPQAQNGQMRRRIEARHTYRLFASVDAGQTWVELVPPVRFHQDDLDLRGSYGRRGMAVFNDGNAARFYIATGFAEGPVYQTTVPTDSPP